MFSTGLSKAQIERLAILIEELGEAQQAVGKILRHGYDSYNPLLEPDADGNPVTCNRDDLEKELGDVRYAIGLLSAAGDIHEAEILRYRDAKHEKARPYLHHQVTRGPRVT
jgi:NTP pyrophosphatase (non-canonical NTP hydrolase)